MKVAINICGVNEALSAQITKMLEYTEVIDECDTLGQKLISDDTIQNVRRYHWNQREALHVLCSFFWPQD